MEYDCIRISTYEEHRDLGDTGLGSICGVAYHAEAGRIFAEAPNGVSRK